MPDQPIVAQEIKKQMAAQQLTAAEAHKRYAELQKDLQYVCSHVWKLDQECCGKTCINCGLEVDDDA